MTGPWHPTPGSQKTIEGGEGEGGVGVGDGDGGLPHAPYFFTSAQSENFCTCGSADVAISFGSRLSGYAEGDCSLGWVRGRKCLHLGIVDLVASRRAADRGRPVRPVAGHLSRIAGGVGVTRCARRHGRVREEGAHLARLVALET